MHIQQRIFTNGRWGTPSGPATHAQLALIFGSAARLEDPQTWSDLAGWYPGARLVGCSTAGEVAGVQVFDDGLVATAIEFEHGRVAVAAVTLDEAADSAALGALLASRLPPEGLVHVLIVSEGLAINGSALVAGLLTQLSPGVGVSGGGPLRSSRSPSTLTLPHTSGTITV